MLLTQSLDDIVTFVYKQSQEDKWWELYLATLPLNEKSYDDWKKEMQGQTRHQTNEVTSKVDAEKIIEKSQNILSGFKPPQ